MNAQVEFADVVLLNKTDMVTVEQSCAVEAFIKKLNFRAKIYRTIKSDVVLENILNTHLFDMGKAQVSAHPNPEPSLVLSRSQTKILTPIVRVNTDWINMVHRQSLLIYPPSIYPFMHLHRCLRAG